MLRGVATGMFGMSAVVCVIAAVACSDSAPSVTVTPPPSQVAPEPPPKPEMPWSPDIAVALIPDIAGYFRDCNCSGANIGGLERVPYAANDAPTLHYLFYGDTLFQPKGNAAGKRLSKTAVERIVSSTALLWRDLGQVAWLPSPADMEALLLHQVSAKPLERFIVTAPGLDGVEVRIGEGVPTITLGIGENSYVATGPMRNASGREIAIVGVWRNGESSSPPVLSRTLGTVALHRPAEGSPTWGIMSSELAKAPVLVSTWRVYLPASMPRSTEIGRYLDAHEVRLAHGGQGVAVDAAAFLTTMRGHVESCEGCHAKAVEAWTQSPHAKAWLTLKSKAQHNNPSCLSCHVENAATFENAEGVPKAEHFHRAAVTCKTCHTSGDKPTLKTCETCHNEHTDPKGLYNIRFKSICPGDKPYQKEGSECPSR